MDISTRTLRAVVLAPDLAISTALWLIGAALLPSPATALALVFGPALLTGLWLCRTGWPGAVINAVAGLQARGRRLRPDETAALAPVIARLTRHGIERPNLLVRRRCKTLMAEASGRDHVVISTAVIDTVAMHPDSHDAIATQLAHAVAHLRVRPTRGDVALGVWTLPALVLGRVLLHVSRATRGLPLVRFAWSLRALVAAVAVAQSVTAGHLGAVGVVVLFVTSTYLVPWAGRTYQARIQAAANEYVKSRVPESIEA